MKPQDPNDIDPRAHRRLLRFINQARQPEDLLHPPRNQYIPEEEVQFRGPNAHDPTEDENREEPLIDREEAEKIFYARDRLSPLHGFINLDQLTKVVGPETLRRFVDLFSTHLGGATFGEWSLAGSIPLAATGGVEVGVVHGALLRSGKVLFIAKACTVPQPQSPTPMWDANNRTTFTVSSPTPPSENLYCSGHAFLSDGKLLVVGGGGEWGNATNLGKDLRGGYIFDPDLAAESWSHTQDTIGTQTRMHQDRWYPTVVNLGDQGGLYLIAGGRGSNQMEVYSENSGEFSLVIASPSEKTFPPTYPGMNVLPGGEVFFTPVGFRDGNESSGDDSTNEDSGYFQFDPGYATGTWTNTGANDRTKGMQVLLLQPTFPFVRVMVIGGGNLTRSRTYQQINLSALSPSWLPSVELPRLPTQTDAASRIHPNVVLLPDGSVFMCGGTGVTEPCWLYNATPQTMAGRLPDTWAEMDELPVARRYHSMALLLPSGEVMVAGQNNNQVHVFKPPYLFRGTPPVITGAPDLVHHGRSFTVTTDVPAIDIDRVVLMRPMAATHQTETEQRVIRLMSSVSGTNAISATMPNGWHPHGLAPAGWYMLFVIDKDHVPSVARFIQLH